MNAICAIFTLRCAILLFMVLMGGVLYAFMLFSLCNRRCAIIAISLCLVRCARLLFSFVTGGLLFMLFSLCLGRCAIMLLMLFSLCL